MAARRLEELVEELARVNRYLDAIVENIPDMIFVKDAKTLLFQRFNRAGEQLLGWKREELLGKTDHDFYPKEQADFFHAKDRETLRGKQLVDIPEEPIETKDKGLRWLHTKKVPVLDDGGEPLYLLGISEDITARKEAEERVHALERELAQVVQHAREAIVTWRLDGTIVSWNPGAAELYGLTAAQAVGRPIETFVPASAKSAFRADVKRALAGEAMPLSEVYRLKDGFEVEVEERLFVLRDPSGGPARIASIARDVTEIARLRLATEVLVGRGGSDDGDAEAQSPAMRDVLETADAVAHDATATVLILGETGVGKSWLARRLHARSPRAAKPFLEINCASLGPQLVESELFGHERGAFTGATAQKRGLVEAAEGGTLFLDEIGELPAGVQAQLLTFLDTRSFRRVGGTRTMIADVRILAATNADLRQLAESGAFRKDLYYRLSVIPLRMPPLRDRGADLPALAKSLLRTLARAPGRKAPRLDRQVLAALRGYPWPGNVRELRNALERAVILARGAPLGIAHLPPELRDGAALADASSRLDELERRHIDQVLTSVKGNRTKAAELLGISRSTLKRKLAERIG